MDSQVIVCPETENGGDAPAGTNVAPFTIRRNNPGTYVLANNGKVLVDAIVNFCIAMVAPIEPVGPVAPIDPVGPVGPTDPATEKFQEAYVPEPPVYTTDITSVVAL